MSVPPDSPVPGVPPELDVYGHDVSAPGVGEPELRRPIAETRLQRFRAWRFAPLVEIIATIAVALALAESVQAAVVKPFVIPSASMEPTLLIGQRVLVNRLAYDFSSPHRGDIVVFHPPNSLTCAVNVPATEPCPRSNPQPASQYFVKRVIGVPGDHLAISDGHPVINGKPLWNEPYITQCVASGSCNFPHAITVPPGEYFMLGDNRGDSDDSRFWGPIPGSWIIGEVFATYWPLDRIGIF
jgi:signal peptidase I